LQTWEDYRDFKRLGRRSRLKESQRKEIWEFYVRQRDILGSRGKITMPEVYYKVAIHLQTQNFSVFDGIIVDEAQDLSPSQMTFIASLSKEKKNYFFSGDLGQRIFQIPYSWSSFGMDIRGRSFTLKVNYRTSEQIRKSADRLLSKEISDYDGNTEKRIETISLFQGPEPEIYLYDTEEEEAKANSNWIKELGRQGVNFQEILLVLRSVEELKRLEHLKKSGIEYAYLEKEKSASGKISVSTMHSAKGLEYRIVLIIACDSNVIPKSSRLEKAGDESELEEIYATERQLLYVACTRARDLIRITGLKPGSEFLEDMMG
jgi:superfamily I DNA/RNA helicase